jgi:outer membrane immunogenic protein
LRYTVLLLRTTWIETRGQIMKKFLLGTVALFALGMAAPASAADLAARPYTKAPPIAAPMMYDWSGFYIGANGGYGWARQCLDVTQVGFVNVFSEGCNDKGGGVVGGQIGYRWQAGSWVFGLEAQGDWANLRTERVFVNTPFLNTTNTWKSTIDGLGLFTGQVGYAWNNSLLYVKGGAAVASQRFDIFNTATGIGLLQADRTRWGGTVGVGWEYGFSPNWTAGIEYDYLFRESDSRTVLTPGLNVASITANTRSDISMITGRISYKFGGYGAPIAARY